MCKSVEVASKTKILPNCQCWSAIEKIPLNYIKNRQPKLCTKEPYYRVVIIVTIVRCNSGQRRSQHCSVW